MAVTDTTITDVIIDTDAFIGDIADITDIVDIAIYLQDDDTADIASTTIYL